MQTHSSLTTGSLDRSIWVLALPAIGSMSSHVVFEVIDAYWVGQAGTTSLAALAAGSFLLWALYSLMLIVSTGTTSIVARRVGEQQEQQARYVANQALKVALLISFLVAATVFITSDWLFAFMNVSPAVSLIGPPFLQVFALGCPLLFLGRTVDAIFRGRGDTKTPMFLIFFAVFLNIILDPFLILGWGPFPRLDVAGAAIATVVSRAVALLLGLQILKWQGWLELKTPSLSYVDWHLAKRCISIGLPHALSGCFFCLMYVILVRLMQDYGPAPIAAMGLSQRWEGIVYFVLVGFAITCATLVGQNLGAKQPQRAEKSVWRIMIFASIFSLIVMALIWWQGKELLALMTDDPKVVAIGHNYLLIISCSFIFMGLEIILEGAFSGAGNTLPAMVIITTGTALRIPLVMLVNHYLVDVTMIWVCIAGTTVLKGIAMAYWFRLGYWKMGEV